MLIESVGFVLAGFTQFDMVIVIRLLALMEFPKKLVIVSTCPEVVNVKPLKLLMFMEFGRPIVDGIVIFIVSAVESNTALMKDSCPVNC